MAPRSLSGQTPRPHRCCRRRYLLKGCGRWFEPTHPQCRYCSAACREAARRWRRWHAQQKYRRSRNGREHRQEQAGRYRERCRSRPARISAPSAATGSAAAVPDRTGSVCEGRRPAEKSEKVPLCPCDRPGCYVHFAVAGVSPRHATKVRPRPGLRRPPGYGVAWQASTASCSNCWNAIRI